MYWNSTTGHTLVYNEAKIKKNNWIFLDCGSLGQLTHFFLSWDLRQRHWNHDTCGLVWHNGVKAFLKLYFNSETHDFTKYFLYYHKFLQNQKNQKITSRYEKKILKINKCNFIGTLTPFYVVYVLSISLDCAIFHGKL